jgi:Glycosyl transferase family 2
LLDVVERKSLLMNVLKKVKLVSMPPITLIIPSRERADVLLYALKSAVAQDYANLRILVSDNASTDNTREVVASFKDRRVSYCNPGKRLSMTENWNFALSQVSEPGIIAFMGDDDGVVPCAIALAAHLMSSRGLKVLRTSAADYHWPKRNQKSHGLLRLPLKGGFELRNSAQWLDKVFCEGSPYSNLPVIYNGGFVHTDVWARIKHNGKHLHSSIPDVYSGVALASVVENYGFTEVPFFVNGASQHSTGTSTFGAGKTSEFAPNSPAQRFVDEGNIPFHPSLPMLADGHYPRSTRIMAYDAFLLSSFLRKPFPHIHAQQQLTQFLAASATSRHGLELRAWCREFAERNSLSYSRAAVLAVPLVASRYISRKMSKQKRKRDVEVFDSVDWPLLTVDEAAQFAGKKLAIRYNDLRKKAIVAAPT